MRLIGNRPPHKWPVKVFWILVFIHLPIIALMVVTNLVQGTLLSMIVFWTVAVPAYVISLLLDPVRLACAVVGAYLIYYVLRCDWKPFLTFLFGSKAADVSNFVRGRRLNNDHDIRTRLASRRMTLRGPDSERDRHFGIRH